jgi:hypothetical protein
VQIAGLDAVGPENSFFHHEFDPGHELWPWAWTLQVNVHPFSDPYG